MLLKKLYGSVDLSCEEQEISKIFKIEYYKIKEEKYGLEIIKRTLNQEIESKIIRKIYDEEKHINELLEILKRNKVTPTELEYILEDLNYNSIGMV